MKKISQRLFAINALLALACYATSYLTLSQAVPPGYSTPLWPAAGLSVASVLLYGYAVLPGIWLGSWALNFFHSGFNVFDLQQLLLPVCIASASTAQAVCARFLTKRICGLPLQLDGLRSIVLYLFLVLPLACLVASTLGSATLMAFHKAPQDFVGITWLTWWIGDLVGAALFSIMTFCFFGEPQKLWRPRRMLLGIPTAIITCALFLLYQKTAGWQSDRMTEHAVHHGIQVELELALLKRTSDLKWAELIEALPQKNPASFLALAKKQFPTLKSLSLQRGDQELFRWNSTPGPVDPWQPWMSPRLPQDQRQASELFAITSARLGILHKALVRKPSEPGVQVVALVDLSEDLIGRLAGHQLNGLHMTFSPRPLVQTRKIENKDPFVLHTSHVFQQVSYSIALPLVHILKNSGLEYIIVMIFSVIFTLSVLSLILLSSGQSYHFERLFLERTEALKEQKILTEHASKLAALGEMAGSIAHEINNPLAIIQGYSEILQTKLNRGHCENHEMAHGLKRIEQTCRRISAIIVSLRSYARDDSSDELVSCQVRDIIGETLELCREGLKDRNIAIMWDESSDATIIGSKAGLMQVLLNLIANARDATASLPTRWIRISIDEPTGEETLVIRVSDSGPGIARELQEKIMLPFFTTKPLGKGTGLGLSISRNLMQSMGGDLLLDRSAVHTSFLIHVKRPGSAPVFKSPARLTRAHELSPH